MYYRHNLDYKYPEKSDEHMITVKKKRTCVFDEDFPYFPKGFAYGTIRVILWIGLNLIGFPLLRITHGLRLYGSENIKKHKKLLEHGCITVSNHVFMWDFMCIMRAMRPKLGYFPAWKTNFDGPNGPLIRMSGGIPVPTDNFRAMAKFNRAMKHVLETERWMHFFPEGSMWFFYPDIRPLKKAVFTYAVQYDKPVLPITLSFRPRKGITKLFTKKPQVDLHVGEPVLWDKSLTKKEAEEKLRKEVYHIMQVMNGIEPGHPSYNTDQNIQNYKKTM